MTRAQGARVEGPRPWRDDPGVQKPPALELPVVIDLPAGGRLTVRQMAEDDIDGIDALYDGLSVEDRYRRFFSPFVGSRFARSWFERTRDEGFALVAVVDDGGPGERLVADIGYVVLPNGDAEFGLTVARDWRGWLGPYLLDLLVAVAAEHGILNLEADILAENRPMQTVVRRRGVVTMGDGEDFSVIRVAIAAASHDRPSWPATPGHHRLLVESSGGRWAHARDATHAGFEVMSCGGPDARCPALEGRAVPACGRRRRHRARPAADRRAHTPAARSARQAASRSPGDRAACHGRTRRSRVLVPRGINGCRGRRDACGGRSGTSRDISACRTRAERAPDRRAPRRSRR